MSFKNLFKLNIPSLFLCLLPYLSFHWIEIWHSSYFSFIQLIILLLSIAFIQILNAKLYMQKKRVPQFISIFTYTSFLLIFYGVNLIDLYFRWEMRTFHHQAIRNRIIFIIAFFSTLFIQNLFLKFRPIFFKFQNIFFLVLFTTTSISAFYNYQNQNLPSSLHSSYLRYSQIDSSKRPILLIIADEYCSPIEISNSFKDSNALNFANQLTEKGWIVKNQFHSQEISTIYSLSSLFNYNLSNDANFAKIGENKLGADYLQKSSLNDSLLKKKVSIINYGIFDFGSSKPLNRLYFYPKNFFEEIFCHSAIPMIFYNSDGLKLKGLKVSYFPWEEHNRTILETLADTMHSVANTNTFCYAHLYMPHTPMVYLPEFPFHIESPENYFEYWKFTNTKLDKLLRDLVTKSNCRIILTGDHGYRHLPNKINPTETFGAFFGFTKEEVDRIITVQDIGSLINGRFY